MTKECPSGLKPGPIGPRLLSFSPADLVSPSPDPADGSSRAASELSGCNGCNGCPFKSGLGFQSPVAAPAPACVLAARGLGALRSAGSPSGCGESAPVASAGWELPGPPLGGLSLSDPLGRTIGVPPWLGARADGGDTAGSMSRGPVASPPPPRARCYGLVLSGMPGEPVGAFGSSAARREQLQPPPTPGPVGSSSLRAQDFSSALERVLR